MVLASKKRKDNPVTIKCYGKEYKFPKRSKAVEFILQAYNSCDPNSSEAARYTTIMHKLLLGQEELVSDE